MTPLLLTFAGRIASGKSTLSRQVATSLGWPWASFGDYVRAEAERQGMDSTSRAVLQQVSDQLLVVGWQPFCRAVLAQAHWVAGTNLVLDGIRHVEALTTLRELVSPQRIALVFVDTPEVVRGERLRSRGVAPEQQIAGDLHESEMQARGVLIGGADFVVDGALPLDEATHAVLSWIAHYSVKGTLPS